MRVKILIKSILTILFILFSGCSNKDNNPVNNPGGITVAFVLQIKAGQQQGYTEFDAEPSTNVTITTIYVTETSGTGFTDQIPGAVGTIYRGGTWYQLTQYTGINSGMKFIFQFVGYTSPGGIPFDVTTDLFIP